MFTSKYSEYIFILHTGIWLQFIVTFEVTLEGAHKKDTAKKEIYQWHTHTHIYIYKCSKFVKKTRDQSRGSEGDCKYQDQTYSQKNSEKQANTSHIASKAEIIFNHIYVDNCNH